MTQPLRKRIVNGHPSDIPEFDSEDAEREWWAEHELGPAAWREPETHWSDLPYLLPLELRADEVPQVESLLEIARQHAALAGHPASERTRLRHALAALVFSAAAVESALNLCLASPHVRFSEDASVVPMDETPPEIDLPWRVKLNLVAQAHAPDVSPGTLEAVGSLCARRAQLLHAVPPLGDPGVDDVYRSSMYVSAARDFLRALRLPRPDQTGTD